MNRLIIPIIFTAIIAAITSCNKITPDSPIKPEEAEQVPELLYRAPENKGFKMIAYFPYYRELDPVSIPDESIKRVNIACFAFATIKNDFTVDLHQPGNLYILANRCKALGVKVLLSFNGEHDIFLKMTMKKKYRDIFILSLKDIVNQYGLDGIDNDWEYPTKRDQSYLGNLYLMRELSNYLHSPDENKLLTMAITCGKYIGNISNGIVEECYPCVDWFNVMTYDDFSTTSAGIHHSPMELLVTGYNYWVGTRGLSSNKFVGGIPIYGRASGITQSGTTLTYKNIISQGGDPDANQATVTSSSYNDGKTPYTIYYNGRPLVREKVDFCIEKETGGIMFWEAGQDMHDERSLIKTAFDRYKSKQ